MRCSNNCFVDRNSRKERAHDLHGPDREPSLKRYTGYEALRDSPVYSPRSTARRSSACSIARCLPACKTYRKLLDEKGYFDYSSIMEEAVALLTKEDSSACCASQDRIKYVIVDEYQDVNPIQEAIVWSLHELGARICVVGDDDQTIYQWRGSDVDNILTFAQRYPAVDQISIEENFRSSEGVVETARPFIEQEHRSVSRKR